MALCGGKNNFMKKILVGFDGSEGSMEAIQRALNIINEDGELVLLAVVPSPEDKLFVDPEIYKEFRKKAEKLIDDVKENLKSNSVSVNGIVEEGDAAVKIIDVANRLSCDLIVLGSRGTSEIGRYLLGSVANKVVQYAHKPVMLVR